MELPQDFKTLQDQIQAALIATTRSASQISSEDLGFQRSLHPPVGKTLDEQNGRLLSLSASLLKSAASISDLSAPILDDVDDVDNNWRSVIDVVDSLLEKADTCLDEYTGVIKRQSPSGQDQVSRAGGNIMSPLLTVRLDSQNQETTPFTTGQFLPHTESCQTATCLRAES